MNLEPGWYPDPYFLERERYWDGKWTDQVRPVQHEQPAVDPDPAATHDATAAPTVGSPADSVPADTAVIAPERRSPSAASTSAAREDDTLVVPVRPGPRPDDTATLLVAPPADVDTGVLPAVSPNGAPADTASVLKIDSRSSPDALEWEASRAAREEAAAARARNGRRKLGYLALAGLGLVAIGVVVAVLVSGSGGGANHPTTVETVAPVTGPAQSVPEASTATATPTLQAAATTSMAKKSVGTAVALLPADSSQSIPQPIQGSGAFVLNVGLGPLAVTGAGGSTKSQKLLFQGATVYVNVSDSPVSGKSWVVGTPGNLPMLGAGSDLSSLVATMGNPGLLLNQLASTPISVSSRGTSSIGGTTVHVYDVNFTSDSSARIAAGYGIHISEEVDVGPGQVVRQIVMPGVGAIVNGQSVPENIVVTFTRYGKPLVITPPPFSELISLSQYLTRPAPASTPAGASGNS